MNKSFLFLAILALFLPTGVFGEMSSTNYSIIFDAVGVSGGDYLTSPSYSLSETIGETPVFTATSTSYTVEGGYQSAYFGILSFSLSSNSLSLGTLSTTTINTASVIANVTSENFGYNLTINSVSGSMPTAVVGGTVATGTEAYGFAASGSNVVVIGDVPVTAGTTIASTTLPITADLTTITFKASASATSTPGNYSQNIDLVLSANL